MDYVEKQLRLLEMYKSDYENKHKHKHLWDVFFKSIYAIVFILGVCLFEFKGFADLTGKKILFCLFEAVTTTFSCVILTREYYVVRVMNRNFTHLCMMMGLDRLPKVSDDEKNWVERMEFKTGKWMCLTVFIVGMISIAVIVIMPEMIVDGCRNGVNNNG